MRFAHVLVTASFMAASAAPAYAQTALLTFDDVPGNGIFYTNLTYRGFIFSPREVMYVAAVTANLVIHPSPFIGTTQTTGPLNPQYLGPQNGPLLFVTRADGLPFNIEGLTTVGASGGIVTSNGGSFSFPGFGNVPVNGAVSFSGPQWSNLQWFGLSTTSGDTAKGFDNLVVTVVPEPGTALLMAMGIAGVVALRRSRPSSPALR